MIRYLNSTTLLVLPCIALFNVISWAVVEFTPIKTDILGPAERLIVLRKLDTWHNTKPSGRTGDKKSIVFISSSLGIAAANMADYEMYGAPDPYSQLATEYSQYKCLDQQIRESSGKPTRTVNLSNVAALISEDLLVAKEAVRLHGKPSLIILAIAPRDFLDHYTAAYHRSRLAQILMTRQAGTYWNSSKSIQANLDILACKIWPYYSQRVEYRDLLIKLACESLNRSESLFSATKRLEDPSKNPVPKQTQTNKPEALAVSKPTEKATQPAKPLVLTDDLASEDKLVKFDNDYRGRYLPIDSDRWNLEMESLRSFTHFCNEEKIPLLVVTMPITARNRNILPPAFLAEHMKAVTEIAASSPTKFLNLMADERFVPSDFSDTVHLRSPGAIKLAKLISGEIQQQRLLP